MVWSARGGGVGGGLACAERGRGGAAKGHKEGRDLTQALRKP